MDYTCPDSQYWWETLSTPLAALCRKADYSVDAQFRFLLLFRFYIAPYLGCLDNTSKERPVWPSFMTDDFTPVELGWDFGKREDGPIIRLSVEPIGRAAGSPSDPYNVGAANQLMHHLSRIMPGMDLSWYNYLHAELVPWGERMAEQYKRLPKQGHKSRAFIGFDLGHDRVTTKAYFFPGWKAAHTGQRPWSVITSVLKALPNSPHLPAHAVLQEYLETCAEGSKLQAEMVAIDCVAPNQSRVKIYFRTGSTSLLSVRTHMTLNGRITSSDMRKGLLELEGLWRVLFGKEDDRRDTEELRPNCHRTSGMLYYFEMRPGQALPVAKVYLPVRHYGESDKVVLIGLTEYLEGRGQARQAASYLEALEVIRSAPSPNSFHTQGRRAER
ncbi:MAG: hypothetical protein Q9216_004380 [Gyalolechia sp. 2 TL-2023]